MRRLLLRQRLYGTKIGSVWAVYPADLEAFKRMRRPPGRPRKIAEGSLDRASVGQMKGERKLAGTDRLLRKRPIEQGRKRPPRVA